MGILRQLAEYLYIKKKDPNAPATKWMRYMHGINRISVMMFLLAIIIIIAVSWDIAAERRARELAAPDSGADEAEPEPGETVGAAARLPRGHYRVPPMDLPHYHGVGLTGPAGAVQAPPGSVTEAGDANSTKEVTGA